YTTLFRSVGDVDVAVPELHHELLHLLRVSWLLQANRSTDLPAFEVLDQQPVVSGLVQPLDHADERFNLPIAAAVDVRHAKLHDRGVVVAVNPRLDVLRVPTIRRHVDPVHERVVVELELEVPARGIVNLQTLHRPPVPGRALVDGVRPPRTDRLQH